MLEDAPRRNSVAVAPEDLNRVLGLEYPAYAAADAINAHGLMDLMDSPAAYRWRLANPSPPSDDLILGTAFDMALTEPERFAATVLHGDRRKVKPEEGQIVLTPGRWEQLQGMLAGVRRNAIATELLGSQVHAQPTVFWQDAVHGVTCKARLDLVCRLGGRAVAVDIKTARSASPTEFSRACATYRYDLQMAHYLEAGRATGLWAPDLFLFVVVDKTAPYDCFVYQAGDTFFARGVTDRDHAMQLYAQCRAAGDWPGPVEFQRLELPAWAKPVEEPEAPDLGSQGAPADDMPEMPGI